MNPIRREFLNGLFVLVVASLMSAAFAAFQISVNLQLWVLILIGVGVAITGYVMFDVALRFMASAEGREKEWLKRVGKPFELGMGGTAGIAGAAVVVDAVREMRPGSDLTIMIHLGREGGSESVVSREAQEQVFGAVMEQLQRGTIREYKRIICFEHDVWAKDHESRSGILNVGVGQGRVSGPMGEHCRLMLGTKGCSLYVAPAFVQQYVALFGTDKACTSVETFDQDTGARATAGTMFFYDPPNGEIIEQFRQIARDRETHGRRPQDSVPRRYDHNGAAREPLNTAKVDELNSTGNTQRTFRDRLVYAPECSDRGISGQIQLSSLDISLDGRSDRSKRLRHV